MTTATITRTRNYLVIKIPLKRLSEKKISIEERAVEEGIKAVAGGRMSKRFNTAREAVSFLRKL